MLENKGFGVVKNEKDFIVFENMENNFLDYGIRDHKEQSSQTGIEEEEKEEEGGEEKMEGFVRRSKGFIL